MISHEQIVQEIRNELQYAEQRHHCQIFSDISQVKNIAIRKLLEYNTGDHLYKPSAKVFSDFQEELNCIFAAIAILIRGISEISGKQETAFIPPTQAEQIQSLIKEREKYFRIIKNV